MAVPVLWAVSFKKASSALLSPLTALSPRYTVPASGRTAPFPLPSSPAFRAL